MIQLRDGAGEVRFNEHDDPLGKGSFGTVYLGSYQDSPESVSPMNASHI